ncbi:MAG TPA: flagellin [Bacteroidetes bacterium]|nr:flagellin [Bacteroidota bacterium]
MKIFKILKKKDAGSIGIGAMIVFIAMVLVAGIAASVLIQTSTTLESQALATGRQTTDEVAGGIAVFDVEGHVSTDIDGLAITVRTRAGSPEIDLNETIIILTDGTTKVLLTYDYADSNHFNASVNQTDGDVFGFLYTDLTNEEFGIMVLEDADNSVSRYNPVINQGDKVMLFVNAQACFGGDGIAERTKVFGHIYPEYGSPGVISFRTPSSYSDTVYDLQ